MLAIIIDKLDGVIRITITMTMMRMTTLKVLSRRRATYAEIPLLWNPVMMNIYHHSQKY